MLRTLSPLLISILLFACNKSKTYFNPEAWKVPGDDAFLKGRVKQVESTGTNAYVQFDRNGNITATNASEDDLGSNRRSIIRNEYYPDNHIKQRIFFYTINSPVYTIDTFVQTGSQQFKMYRVHGKDNNLWMDGADSTSDYSILKYDHNGFLKRKEFYHRSFLKQRLVKDEMFSSDDFENNSSGYPTKVSGWYLFDGKKERTVSYYLSKWNLPDSIRVYDQGLQMLQYNQFDQYGNIIERKIHRGSYASVPHIEKFAYEYDVQGNWITKTTTFEDRPPKTEKRTITYWD